MLPPDYAGEPKLNKVRSIQAPPAEPVFVPKNPRLRTRAKQTTPSDGAKPNEAPVTRKSFEKTSELKSRSTTTRRRGTPTSSSTAAPVTQKPSESGSSRFKPTRKSVSSPLPTMSKSRRPFATRPTTTESAPIVTSLTTKAPLASQRAPLTRASPRPSEKPRQKPVKAVKDGMNDSSEEENYPEHFKLLLKNKANSNSAPPAVQTINESEKKVARKVTTVKYYRQSPVTTISTPTATESKSLRTTTSRFARSTTTATDTAAKTEKKFHFAQRPRVLARTRATSTTEAPQSVVNNDQSIRASTNRQFKRPKPTDRMKSSTLQEPPTEKPSPIFRARPASGEATNTQTEYDLSKQIDPPIHEYFPRSVSSLTSQRNNKINLFPHFPRFNRAHLH